MKWNIRDFPMVHDHWMKYKLDHLDWDRYIFVCRLYDVQSSFVKIIDFEITSSPNWIHSWYIEIKFDLRSLRWHAHWIESFAWITKYSTSSIVILLQYIAVLFSCKFLKYYLSYINTKYFLEKKKIQKKWKLIILGLLSQDWNVCNISVDLSVTLKKKKLKKKIRIENFVTDAFSVWKDLHDFSRFMIDHIDRRIVIIIWIGSKELRS